MPTGKFRPIPEIPPVYVEKFISLVRTGSPDHCWPWMGNIQSGGYGQFTIPGVYGLVATRVGWKLRTGQDPGDNLICHTCDNPPCMNPSHWFLGSRGDNNLDRHRKGRSVMPKNRARGAKNANAKLDDQKVLEIRQRHANGERQRPLAREYGVSGMTVWSIVHNHYWHHVPHIECD